MESPFGYFVGMLFSSIVGAILGIIITNHLYKKQIKELRKKMESPDKEQVKNMLSALGQKPSEEQVNRFMNIVSKKKESKKPKKVSKKKK
ncbi:MAG: Co-chaperone protein DjlA [Mycoplasmataceae bacterium]|nr:MAG: Co-chaperone protein DjlA [Mycoplasmataceae bacterium]